MIQHDEIPAFDTVTEIQFAGSENYKAVYKEENKVTYSKEDVYFVKEGSGELPLDTGSIENYVETIHELNLTDYVTYNVPDEELKIYGLDAPGLTVTLKYKAQDEKREEEKEDTVVFHISRDPAEKEKEDTEEITSYLRVGESKIIYQISGLDYEELMEVSYNALRHQEVIWVDFEDMQRTFSFFPLTQDLKNLLKKTDIAIIFRR